MFTKATIALAIVLGLTSGALAANKRHYDDATAYGHPLSLDDFCRQHGPITLPAKHPVCNTKDFMQW